MALIFNCSCCSGLAHPAGKDSMLQTSFWHRVGWATKLMKKWPCCSSNLFPTKKSAISEFSWSSYTAQPSFFPVHNSGRPSLAAGEKGSQKPTYRSGFGWRGWWNLIEIEIFFWCERIHHISSRPRFGHWNPLQSGPSFIAFRKVKVKTWKDIVSSRDLYEVQIQQVRSKICWFEARKFYLNMTCWRNLMAVAAWNCPKHPYAVFWGGDITKTDHVFVYARRNLRLDL